MTAVKDPYTGLHAESIYAMWHDPLVYDHMKHGPPYLPEMNVRLANDQRADVQAALKKEAAEATDELTQLLDGMTAAYGNGPMAELSALLAFLRAEAWIHQAHHWQTRGCSYYGDHLLFERLYNDAQGMVDGLAEKAVGTGQHLLVHPCLQGLHMMAVMRGLYADAPVNPGADDYPWLSLRAVLRFILFGNLVMARLEAKSDLSHGISNMLEGIEDKHEEFAYLLKQRTKEKTASTKTAGNVRLTPKEINRASGEYTIIVRPQASGGYLVAAVKIEGNTGKIVDVAKEIVEDKGGIAKAVQEVNRWLDKMGYPIEMAWMSRGRWLEADCHSQSAAWKA